MGNVNWDQGAQGAAGGASAGAAFGPYGALIGGAIGGLGGLLGQDARDPKLRYRQMLQQMMDGYRPDVHQAEQSSLVGNRGALIAQLEAMARGEGPSAARQQMQDGMARAVAAQASNAAGAGGRGVNAGAAMRNAGNQSAAIMGQGNRDMGVMRAQEQANAVGQLGMNINNGISADNSMSQFNASQQNAGSQFDQQQRMQMIQMLMGNAAAPTPGTGTQILAAGASAAPTLMQMQQAKQQQDLMSQMMAQQQQQQMQQQMNQQISNPSGNRGVNGMGGTTEAFSNSVLNPYSWNQ